MNDDSRADRSDSNELVIPAGIGFIQGAYCILVSFVPLFVLAKSLGYGSANTTSWLELLPQAMVNLTVLLGLYRKKSWVVPLVLINASWQLINHLFQITGNTTAIDYKIITQKFSHLIFVIFCIYQIVIFTRRKTKEFFQWNGQTIM